MVRTALKAKNKLAFIDGSLNRPKEVEGADLSECHAWDMVSSMLCSWLVNVIEPKLWMTIADSDVAKIMWDDLKTRHGTANSPQDSSTQVRYSKL